MTYYEKAQILNNLVQKVKQEYSDHTLRWHVKRISAFFQVQLLLRDLSTKNTLGYSLYKENPHPLYPYHRLIIVDKNLRPSKKLVIALYLIATHFINDNPRQGNYIVKNIQQDSIKESKSNDDTLCRMFVSDVALDTNKLESVIHKVDQIKGGTNHVQKKS